MGKKNQQKFDLGIFGVWYVPKSDTKIEGYISKKAKRYYLFLITDKTFENQSLSSEHTHFLNYPLINGYGNSIRFCTLYNCIWQGAKKIGENLYRVRYEVEFVFHNTLIDDESELLVKDGLFSFPYLSTWYDGSKSINRLSPHTGIFVNGTEQPRSTQNGEKTVSVTDNMDIVFIDYFDEYSNMTNTLEKKYKKYVRFVFKTPVHFKDLLSFSSYFANLLEVSLFRRIAYSLHRVTFIEGAYSHIEGVFLDKQMKSSKVLNYSLNKGQKVVGGFLHQNYMLISRWKFNENALDNVIKAWFANRNYSHIYDYFIDSHFWAIGTENFLTNVMFNNRFLNMLHGIEAFHELFYGKEKYEKGHFENNKIEILKLIKDKKLKQWFNNNLNAPKYKHEYLKDKLNHLIDEFEHFFTYRFGSIMIETKNFFLRAVKYRNILSHGSQDSTYQGEEFGRLFLAIQYLLTLCILKSLNIDTVKNTIELNYPLNESINEIIKFINDNVENYREIKINNQA